jgi:transcriptional regulator with XRE-family HTH domain
MAKDRKPAMPNGMREARIAHGLTQEQVAAMTGLSHSFIQRAETGQRDPSAGTMRKIARALRKHPGELFFDYVGPPDMPADQAAVMANKMDPDTRETWLSIGRTLLSKAPTAPHRRRRPKP